MAENNGKVSISELGRMTGLDRVTLGKRLTHIKPEQGAKGAKLYDLSVALHAIKAPANNDDAEQLARNRKLEADAEKAELTVARLRGEVVPVEDMKQAAAEMIKTIYQRTVRVSPQILASKLVGKTDVLDIETIIRTELSGIFNELRTLPENFLTVEASEIEESETE